MIADAAIPPVRIPPRPVRRRRWIYLVIAIGGMTALVVLAGLVFLGREYLAEISGHGFHVNRSAARDFQEARKLRPGCQLRLTGYYDRVSSMVFVNADLVTNFDPKNHVQLEVRGVSLVVERGIYDHQRYSHPIVMHQGADPTKGYSVSFWRKANAFGG